MENATKPIRLKPSTKRELNKIISQIHVEKGEQLSHDEYVQKSFPLVKKKYSL